MLIAFSQNMKRGVYNIGGKLVESAGAVSGAA
jgi:hypothetical protein